MTRNPFLELDFSVLGHLGEQMSAPVSVVVPSRPVTWDQLGCRNADPDGEVREVPAFVAMARVSWCCWDLPVGDDLENAARRLACVAEGLGPPAPGEVPRSLLANAEDLRVLDNCLEDVEASPASPLAPQVRRGLEAGAGLRRAWLARNRDDALDLQASIASLGLTRSEVADMVGSRMTLTTGTLKRQIERTRTSGSTQHLHDLRRLEVHHQTRARPSDRFLVKLREMTLFRTSALLNEGIGVHRLTPYVIVLPGNLQPLLGEWFTQQHVRITDETAGVIEVAARLLADSDDLHPSEALEIARRL